MNINLKQKIAVYLGCFLLLLSVLFPVWSVSISGVEVMNSRGFLYSKGIGFLAAYSKKTGETHWKGVGPNVRVDYRRMAAECSLIVLFTIVSVLLIHKKTSRPNSTFVFKSDQEFLSMRKEELEKNQLSGKMRLTIFLSIVWLMIYSIVGWKEKDFEITFFYGGLPLLILWGIWWIIKGFSKVFEKERKGFRKKSEKEKDVDN